MPVIKTSKKILQPPIKYKDNEQSKYYSSHIWQRLRNYYYSRHPLCECCLAHDRYTPAEHVHHRRMFMSGKDDNERWRLLSDQNNLTSCCRVCHEAIHRKIKRYGLSWCDSLTDEEYNAAHNLFS